MAGAVLHKIGLIGWVLRLFGMAVRACIRGGFRLWEVLLGWASWSEFLAVTFVLLLTGGLGGALFPALRILCSLVLMVMGTSACLAYMFIDLERNEVERGYKAVHNPLKGQLLAVNLARYGQQVRIPLLISATVALIGGFALLNRASMRPSAGAGTRSRTSAGAVLRRFPGVCPHQVLGLVDVLDMAKSHHILGAEFVRQAAWPASTLAGRLQALLHPGVAPSDLRLAAAREAAGRDDRRFLEPARADPRAGTKRLPVFGAVAIGPLLASLRSVSVADQGAARPAAGDPGDDRPIDHPRPGPPPARPARARAGRRRLGAGPAARPWKRSPALAALVQDPSDVVRQSVVEALGILGSTGARRDAQAAGLPPAAECARGAGSGGSAVERSGPTPRGPCDPVELAVTTLQAALDDDRLPVRTQAAAALGRIGPPAAAAVPG